MKKQILFILVYLMYSLSITSQEQIKVACIGNSVTYGFLMKEEADKYPAKLQVMLGDNYKVKNFGYNGACLLKKSYRPYWNLDEFTKALKFKPDIVVIHLGLNDTDPRSWARFRDEFIRDYIDLIDTFKTVNPKAEVKICRMTPIFTGHKRFKSSTREWFWQIQEAIETIAKIKQIELIDLHTPLYRRPDLFPDNLHPNVEGTEILAKTVYQIISKDFGGLQMSPLFSDGMVIQRNRPVKFYGIANAGTRVKLKFNKQVKYADVQYDGRWQVVFPAMNAGGPYYAEITNEKTKIKLNDIFIGDVWLCSGQSNMEFSLKESAKAKSEIPKANIPNMRLFNMKSRFSTTAIEWDSTTLDSVNKLEYFKTSSWEQSSPESASDFSAIAYHFGKQIQQKTNIPIGLILNAVGGSTCESWIDRKTLEHHNRLVDMFHDWENNDYIHPWCRQRYALNTKLSGNKLQRHPYKPAYLYEAGIAPLIDYNIAGVIWYQGESNAHNVELYEVLFPSLVDSWRKAWNYNLPFYYVQLSSMAVNRETWGYFRNAQRKLLSVVPNSGMAVCSDLGDSTDVHPRRKQQVGERLARWALNKTYGMQNTVVSGPLFKEVTYKNDTAYISFDYNNSLQSTDNEFLMSFEIAEYPGLYYKAKAEIVNNKVKLYSKDVKRPRYVRYGMKPFSDGNLINSSGLPASTFISE